MTERQKAYARTYYLKRYHKLRLEAIKALGGKCVSCGAADGLDFDHINPAEKVIDISIALSRKRSTLEAELVKCQLLCKPCHRLKHNYRPGCIPGAEIQAARRAKAVARGYCSRCACRPARPSRKICASCTSYNREAYLLNHANRA